MNSALVFSQPVTRSIIGFGSSVKFNKGICGKIFDIFTKYVNSILFKYRLRPEMQSSSNDDIG